MEHLEEDLRTVVEPEPDASKRQELIAGRKVVALSASAKTAAKAPPLEFRLAQTGGAADLYYFSGPISGFRYGEYFYNFRGLRKYKEKFDPVWEPIYLACPGGFKLPVVLTNIASLISGSTRGVVMK